MNTGPLSNMCLFFFQIPLVDSATLTWIRRKKTMKEAYLSVTCEKQC